MLGQMVFSCEPIITLSVAFLESAFKLLFLFVYADEVSVFVCLACKRSIATDPLAIVLFLFSPKINY
jgi:hypothetical protein